MQCKKVLDVCKHFKIWTIGGLTFRKSKHLPVVSFKTELTTQMSDLNERLDHASKFSHQHREIRYGCLSLLVDALCAHHHLLPLDCYHSIARVIPPWLVVGFGHYQSS